MKALLLFLLLFVGTMAQAQHKADAQVVKVATNGKEGRYQFVVSVKSPDKGCNQYADWWEVISDNGTQLLGRRILLHSHVGEQPFTRSSSPISLKATDRVIVRVHMNSTGYSRFAMRGSISEGFEAVELDRNFAVALSKLEPLPKGCAH